MLVRKLIQTLKRIGIKWLMASLNRDVSGLFLLLNKTYEYVICKFEGRHSERFPYTFILGSEVDVLCYPDDLGNLSYTVKKWLTDKYHHQKWVDVSEELFGEHALIYIYVCGLNHKYKCLCVDIQTMSAFNMSQDFLSYCLQKRMLSPNGMCYMNCTQCEIPIRAYELYLHPHKIWHKEYIKGAMSYYDSGILELACNSNHELLKNLKDVIINCSKDIDSSQCP